MRTPTQNVTPYGRVVADGIDSDCDGKEMCLRDQDADGYSDGEIIATVDFTCEGYGLTLLKGDCDIATLIFILTR